MKKVLLFVVLAAVLAPLALSRPTTGDQDCSSALPFAEDFAGVASYDIPPGWERTHINWYVLDTNTAGGVPPEVIFYWNPPTGDDQCRLITPLLDGTSASELLLSFKHFVMDYHGGYTLRVQTSIDGGATWQDRWSVPGDNVDGEVFVNLSPVAGHEFKLAFVFDGDSSDIVFWSIDNIRIEKPQKLLMVSPFCKGAVIPNVGYHDYPLGYEVILSALPSSTWYGFDLFPTLNPFKFDPADYGPITYIGTNSISIYGGTWAADTWYVISSGGSLYTVNPETGALTLIGPTGLSLSGIAYDEIGDIMYASTFTTLYTIDRSTGAVAEIGSFGASLKIIDIAYGDGVLYAHCTDTDKIYTIDVTTGAAALLGSTGVDAEYVQGMEYDKDHGRLYLALVDADYAYLAEVDKATGRVRPWFRFGETDEVDGFAIPYGIDHFWEFDRWDVDGVPYSNEPVTSLLMDKNHTARAVFKLNSALPLPFAEDFTGVTPGNLPAGWAKNRPNWAVANSNHAGGVSPEARVDKYPIGGLDIYRLWTPMLDGSATSNIQLTFKHCLDDSHGGCTLRVQTSIDGGFNWQDRWSVPGEDMSGEVTVNLDAVAGQEFMLAFVFDGDTVDIEHWSIDDIYVAETKEFEMLYPVGRGAVFPRIGKQGYPLGHEITLRALPSSTWYAFSWNPNYKPFMFDPANLGRSITYIGNNELAIYGGTWADGTWYAVAENPSDLYTVNPVNGDLTLIGSTGLALSGLAYDDVNGIMYACTREELYTIDRTTGVTTPIGPFGSINICDIAYGDGVLYAHCILTDSIYTVNVSTGEMTLHGPTGFDATYSQGMEYDKDQGRLFLALCDASNAYLAEVDKTNGSAYIWFQFEQTWQVDGFAIPYGIDHSWEFDRWEVDGLLYSNEPVTSLVMDADYTAQAFFTTSFPTYTLTMLDPGGTGTGAVSPPVGTHLYLENTTAYLRAMPDTCFILDHWEVDGVYYSSDPYETIVMDKDCLIQAFFGDDINLLCSPFDLFSQPVNAMMEGALSDAYADVIAADDFTGLTEPIYGVDFWGAELDGSSQCAKSSLDYIIRFYEYGPLPDGEPLYEETITVAKVASTKYYLDNPDFGSVYKYTAMLSAPVTLANGWFSAQAVDSGNCVFGFVDAGPVTGPADYECATCDHGHWEYLSGNYDLAFCLLGRPPDSTATPTATHTPEPTPTEPPEPTATKPPEPTPTPTPGYPLGVRLKMPDMAHPGEEFSIIGYLDNPDAPLTHVATFFILEVYGKFWFWPSWVYFDYPEYAEIDYEFKDLPTGTTEVVVIPVFEWPDTGSDVVTGLGFYGAMLNPEMNDIMGNFAIKEWGYGPKY